MNPVIVNYGMGNLASIQNMLRKIGCTSVISSHPEDIQQATHLILPGVGHFGRGMEQLHQLGLIPYLEEKVLQQKVPVLGICLGMQLMGRSSEEANVPGLGWINADFVKFRPEEASEKISIPHIGWEDIRVKKKDSILNPLPAEPRFYFVHSYHAVCRKPEDVLAEATYGYTFTAAYSRGNITGVQFHPEKSHAFGMQLFRNFTGS